MYSVIDPKIVDPQKSSLLTEQKALRKERIWSETVLKWNSGCRSCCRNVALKNTSVSPWALKSCLYCLSHSFLSHFLFLSFLSICSKNKNPALSYMETKRWLCGLIALFLLTWRHAGLEDLVRSCDWEFNFLYWQHYGNSFFEARSLLIPYSEIKELFFVFFFWNCIA